MCRKDLGWILSDSSQKFQVAGLADRCWVELVEIFDVWLKVTTRKRDVADVWLALFGEVNDKSVKGFVVVIGGQASYRNDRPGHDRSLVQLHDVRQRELVVAAATQAAVFRAGKSKIKRGLVGEGSEAGDSEVVAT